MRRRRQSESGFALLLIFVLAAGIAISLLMQLPRVAFETARNREEMLIERGEQYKRAIGLYFRKTNRYPVKIEDLENTNNIRFLRRRYIDPMTGKDEWRMIHAGPGGVLTDSMIKKAPTTQNADGKGGGTGSGGLGNANPGFGSMGGSQMSSGFGSSNPGNTVGTANANGAPEEAPGVNAAVLRRPSDRVAGLPNAAGVPPTDPNQVGNGDQSTQPIYPGQPGYPQPGTPGYTGQPIYPGQQQFTQTQVSQPIYPGQPGYPQAGTPGYTGQPIYPGQPGYPQQQQQVASQTGQPIYPGQPGYPQPGTPGYTGQPIYPGQPGYPQQNNQQPYNPMQNLPGSVNPQQVGSGMNQPGFPQMPGQQNSNGFNNGPNPQNPNGFNNGSNGFGNNQSAASMINDILRNPRNAQAGTGAGAFNNSGVQGGIAGVATNFKGPTIKVYKERQKYQEWEFVYDIKDDPYLKQKVPAGGQGMTPAGLGTGSQPQQGGFGQNPRPNR